jgi:predicted Kef-type K+ transport protein
MYIKIKVKLLMRVHHRNLTTLVGYCYEGTNMGLIYEYMANGDLEEHLLGLGVIEILSKK